jgi:cell division protein FtsI (penicillin-binding protein 3)
LVAGLVLARLIQVQVVDARPLRAEARGQQEKELGWPPIRGMIVDREQRPLATTLPPEDALGSPGVRTHPLGSLAVHVVGCCSIDGRGLEGVEFAFEDYLRGKPGRRVVGRNARGSRFTTPGAPHRPPEHGASVILSIDAVAQSVVERELERCVLHSKARAASAVLLRPETGDILAMASYPSYNPQRFAKSSAACRRNRVITDIFEPGSTFKLVTVAACLEEGVASPATRLLAEKEIELAGGHHLRDKEDYGEVTVADAVHRSINTAMAKLSRRLGSQWLYEYARSFGFGCVTGIDLPGEVSGILRRPCEWSGRSLETVAIGQEVAVTLLQLACAYGAVANDGVLMKPRIVREIRNAEGRAIRQYRPQEVRRVVSRETAARLTEVLVGVVENGTGSAARMPGVSVAGKTGTAQVVDRERGGYVRDRYVASFVGFLPAESPELVAAIVVEEPKGVSYGGHVAAPCFRRIVEGTLLASRVPPDFARQALAAEL